MAALEEFLVVLKAQTGEFTGKLSAASGAVKEVEKSGGGAFQKLAGVGKAAFAGIAGGALAAGIASVKLADDYEVAHARLVTALNNTGTSWDAQKKKIEAVTQTGETLGFSMKDTEDALAIMTRGMGDSSKAIGYLGVVQDLARAKGIDLASAATTVTRASEGQLRPLKQLGIDLPIAAGGALKVKQAQDALSKAWAAAAAVQEKIRTGHLKGVAAQQALAKSTQGIRDAQQKLNDTQSAGGQILAALGAKLSGSAAAQADTFGGKMQALKVQLQDVGVRIGLWLIPKLEAVATVMQKVIGWFEKHRVAATALGVVIGGALLVAIAAYTVSMISAAVATIAATWPILAVVAAIGLLVAAALFLWNNWNKVMNFIAHHKALAVVIGILFPIIPLLIAIVGAAKFLYEHWDTIWNGIKTTAETVGGVLSTVWDGITTAIGSIVNVFENFPERVHDSFDKIVDFFKELPARIAQTLLSLGQKLIGVFTQAFQTLANTLPTIGQAILFWFIQLPFKIVGAMITLENLWIKFLVGVFNAVSAALPGIAAGLLNFFRQLPGWIVNAMATLYTVEWQLFMNAFTALVNALPGMAAGVLNFFRDLPGNIISFAGSFLNAGMRLGNAVIDGIRQGITGAIGLATDIGGALIGAFKSAWNSVVGSINSAWNGLPSIDTPFGSIGVPKNIPNDYLRLAKGGIVTGPTFAMIGEAGPEAVIPLNRANKFGNIGGGHNTVINLTVNALDPRAAEDGVIKALQGWARRNGPVPVKVAG